MSTNTLPQQRVHNENRRKSRISLGLCVDCSEPGKRKPDGTIARHCQGCLTTRHIKEAARVARLLVEAA